MKTFFSTVRKSGMRFKGFMFLYILIAALSSVAMVITYQLRGDMSESAIIGDTTALQTMLLIVTAVMAVRAAAAAISTFMLARFSARAGYNLRQYFISHLLRAPFAKVEGAGGGESLSVFQNDITRAEALVSSDIMGVITSLFEFAAAVTFLLIISATYTGILLAAFVILMVLVILSVQPLNRLSKKQSEQTAEFTAVVNDS